MLGKNKRTQKTTLRKFLQFLPTHFIGFIGNIIGKYYWFNSSYVRKLHFYEFSAETAKYFKIGTKFCLKSISINCRNNKIFKKSKIYFKSINTINSTLKHIFASIQPIKCIYLSLLNMHVLQNRFCLFLRPILYANTVTMQHIHCQQSHAKNFINFQLNDKRNK